ncbi:MAG: 2-isopropylmalate synthase [Candidatus Bathyarchaeota archaeon]|jgi:isopropylmalate/citramalate/homocitrate synthase-like protein
MSKDRFYLSSYMADIEKNTPEKVWIFDTTLRDGEQMPGVTYTIDEKILIAQQLDELRVPKIEAGFPITSIGETDAVKKIAGLGLDAEIVALARPLKEDIDRALDCDVPYIHIFISTSDLHIETMMKTTREEVLKQSVESIEYAKDHGVYVEYSPQDATRTDMNYLIEICNAAEDAGAEMLNIPDTVGVMTPRMTYEFFKELKESTRVSLSAHAHNDLGQATANTLVAIEAGAEQAHVCVNGLGERAGNTSLEEVVVSLIAQYGIETGINTQKIAETSTLVERLSGVYMPSSTPIIGDNAFSHEAGIHVHGLLSHSGNYEILSPAFVGKKSRIVAGKHAGRHGLTSMMEDLGLEPTRDQLKAIALEVKTLGDRGKTVTDADLYAIAKHVMDLKEDDYVKLQQLVVVTGNTITPTASVTLLVDGNEYKGSGVGNGPIDSAINAIRNVVNGFAEITLEKFAMKAITGGTDAVADVTVHLRRGEKFVTANGVSGDTVMASVDAILKGMNRLLTKENHVSD